MTRLLATVVLVAGLLGAAGCGSTNSRPVVRGSVTYKGTPALYQTLTLCPVEADQKFMRRLYLDEQGRFQGDAPAPGDYKVVIDLPMAAQEGNTKVPGADFRIPAKYRKLETTDLRWTIVAGSNDRDFVLAD